MIFTLYLADCIVMDFDNDQTEDPSEWMTPDRIASLLPDVNLAIAPSRHNMLPKGSISARPRGHVYFSISAATDPGKYASIKAAICSQYPFFDDNALGAARFIYGSKVKETDIIWHEGTKTIDVFYQFSNAAFSSELWEGINKANPGSKFCFWNLITLCKRTKGNQLVTLSQQK